MVLKLHLLASIALFLLATNGNCHQNHHQDQQNANGAQQHHNPNDQMHLNMNKDHVMEHLDGVINKPKEQMTPDEQNFYYFKLHDSDNNNMLDGLELVNAFAHTDEHDHTTQPPPNNEGQHQPPPPPPKRISDEELIKVIDEIMADEDLNHDGFITYQEFLHAIKQQ